MITDSLIKARRMAFHLEETSGLEARCIGLDMSSYIGAIRNSKPYKTIVNHINDDVGEEVYRVNPRLLGGRTRDGRRILYGLISQFDPEDFLVLVRVARHIVGFADGAQGLGFEAAFPRDVLRSRVNHMLIPCAGEVAHVFDVLIEVAEKNPRRPVKGRNHQRVSITPGIHRELEFFAPEHTTVIKTVKSKEDAKARIFTRQCVASMEIDEALTQVGSNWLNLLGSARALVDMWDTARSTIK